MSKMAKLRTNVAKLRTAQRGQLFLPLTGWLAVGAGVVIIGLGIALRVQSARLASAQEETAKVKGEYSAFKIGVERLGREQEARNKEMAAKQEKINGERYRALQGRYADIAAKYDRLRGSTVNSGGRPMPAVPDTARPVDDTARDQRLLEVLRAAESQTAQLIELQEWIRQQR